MQTSSTMRLMALPLGFLAERVGAANLFVGQGPIVAVVLTMLALGSSALTFSAEVAT